MTTTTTNKVPSPECIYKDSDGDGDDDDADFCFAVPQSVHDRVASQADESNSAVVVLGESHDNHSQSQSLWQSQSQPTQEILTQNVDLTQMADDDFAATCCSSPLPPYSPPDPRQIPWARLLPPTSHSGTSVELLPRSPQDRSSAEPTHRVRSGATESGTVALMGLSGLQPSHIFNEYVIGRSTSKCHVLATKPSPELDTRERALHDWAYGMISNQHCKLYCRLDDTTSFTTPQQHPVSYHVWLEDSSGNGTVINTNTLLRRGEKRRLHSGDQICLVQAATLRKKIRSAKTLESILQKYTYVFVNAWNGPVAGDAPGGDGSQSWSFHSASKNAARRRSLSLGSASKRSSVTRKAAVNARATANHSPRISPVHDDRHRRQAAPWRRPSPTKVLSSLSYSHTRRVEQDYDIRDVLGSGTVGQVLRAIHRQTGHERAVKIIKIKSNYTTASEPAASSATLQAEAAILQSLAHPYIVQLYDVYVSTSAIYLVMELLPGGDLFDRIVDKGIYTETQARQVMRRLLAAVHYLHESCNVVHRDLKPENILLCTSDNDVHIKLTDFGLAKTIDEQGLRTFCGTPQYFAPEVLHRQHTVAGRGRYGKEADLWSAGVILYILLSGTPPFDVQSEGIDAAANSTLQFPTAQWWGVSPAAQDLIRRLLVADPAARWTVVQACQHDWILQPDGDTHTHPLDDPQLAAVVGAQKRLFADPVGKEVQAAVEPMFGQGENTDVPLGTSGMPLSDAVTQPATAVVDVLKDSVAAESTVPRSPSSTTSLLPPNCLPVTGPTIPVCAAVKDARRREHEAATDLVPIVGSSECGGNEDPGRVFLTANLAVTKEERLKDMLDPRASTTSESSIVNASSKAEDVKDVEPGKCVSKVGKTPSTVPSSPTTMDATEAADCGGDESFAVNAKRQPLSPVPLNGIDTYLPTSRDPQPRPSPLNRDSLGIEVTFNSRLLAGDIRKRCTTDPDVPNELSDDEIRSQFSENAESISSFCDADDNFSLTFQERNRTEEVSDGPATVGLALSRTPRNCANPAAQVRKRKRRVTASIGDSLAQLEPVETVSATKENPCPSRETSNMAGANAKLPKKQLKLTNWFKKQKSSST